MIDGEKKNVLNNLLKVALAQITPYCSKIKKLNVIMYIKKYDEYQNKIMLWYNQFS